MNYCLLKSAVAEQFQKHEYLQKSYNLKRPKNWWYHRSYILGFNRTFLLSITAFDNPKSSVISKAYHHTFR